MLLCAILLLVIYFFLIHKDLPADKSLLGEKINCILTSVGDPDPHDFEPSGFISQRYGSGS
jgi:hypothetical protein